MWVARVPCADGFLYRLLVNDADYHVSWQGTCYLHNIGWHREWNTFVSTSDDAILWRHGLIRHEKKGP